MSFAARLFSVATAAVMAPAPPRAAQVCDGAVPARPFAVKMHTRIRLMAMATDPAEAEQFAASATRPDPASAGHPRYDLMTADLRPAVDRIESALLVVAVAQAFSASALDAVQGATSLAGSAPR